MNNFTKALLILSSLMILLVLFTLTTVSIIRDSKRRWRNKKARLIIASIAKRELIEVADLQEIALKEYADQYMKKHGLQWEENTYRLIETNTVEMEGKGQTNKC